MTSKPAELSPEHEQKVRELTAEHGAIVQQLLDDGRIPIRQLDNFYGRHADRREDILSRMKKGDSYNAAYKKSSQTFDTKRWEKIPNRTSSCRGLLLKTSVGLLNQGRSLAWQDSEIEAIEKIVRDLEREARSLIQRLVRYEFQPTRNSEKRKKRSSPAPCDISNCQTSFAKVRTQFATARTKLRKNSRDVPHMLEKLGEAPSVEVVAQTVIEVARIISGVTLLLTALKSNVRSQGGERTNRDVWGVGHEYSQWCSRLSIPIRSTVRIATHQKPDADALVATWLTERFLFPDDECQIVFVPRDFDPESGEQYDAVLDVGRICDPAQLIFDHKPPAFGHRDEHCATSLVWEHALCLGMPVEHLRDLIEVVHDGDAATRRQQSQAYARSRENGLHAMIKGAQQYAHNDQMLYQGITAYLDAKFLR